MKVYCVGFWGNVDHPHIGVILGLYRDNHNGKENANYFLGCNIRVIIPIKGRGFINHG